MKAIARGGLVAALMSLAALSGPPEQARAGEVAKELDMVHILMVIDSNDKLLGESVQKDKMRMRAMWERTIPEGRRSITVLEGDKVNVKNILAYYKKLPARKGEGKVFYYAGHGVTDRTTNKHVLYLSSKERLWREELVAAMDPKQTELIVLLTDCCSTLHRLAVPEKVKKEMAVIPKGKIHPPVSSLFFQVRGVVDVTAATDNASWSDTANGGIFMRGLCKLLLKQLMELDANKDGFLDWGEFFDKLKVETEASFQYWREDLLERATPQDKEDEPALRDLAKKGLKQVPKHFGKLPRRLEAGYLFAAIHNKSDDPLNFQYRWGEGKWTDVALKPDETRVCALMIPKGNADRPTLEIRVKGKGQRVATEWKEGTAKPKAGDAKNTVDIK